MAIWIPPGVYRTTVTAPALFNYYLREQFALMLRNHGVQIDMGELDNPHSAALRLPARPVHRGGRCSTPSTSPLRDLFDVPDLANTDDDIANGTWRPRAGGPYPLAPFTAPRVDYSLHRLQHYTATAPEHFQNFVMFTNYHFYVDDFVAVGAR